MKMFCKRTWQGLSLAACTALCLAMAPSTFAKEKSPVPAEQSAVVIGHLSLTGPSVSRMFLQEQGNKEFLYVQQAAQQGYTVVDVTKPDKAKIVNRVSPSQNGGGKLQMVGGGLALEETPDSSATGSARHELAPAKSDNAPAANRPTESVRVLDLSDPANPKTLQTFQGVTSVLADDSRRLIYIANGEGLWILRHKQPKAAKPACDSESVFSPIADCQ
jgi:hypothetical protein